MFNWINGVLGLIVIAGSLLAAPAGPWKWILLIVGVVVAILGFYQAIGGKGEGTV